MKEIINNIADQLLKGIKKRYGDNHEKVSEVKSFWFYQKYLLFSVANSKRLFGKDNPTLILLTKMAESKLIPGQMIDFYQSNTNIIDNLIESGSQLYDCDENYNYEVIDLGRDVAPERIADEVIKNKVILEIDKE